MNRIDAEKALSYLECNYKITEKTFKAFIIYALKDLYYLPNDISTISTKLEIIKLMIEVQKL